jgi:hypothetical protein
MRHRIHRWPAVLVTTSAATTWLVLTACSGPQPTRPPDRPPPGQPVGARTTACSGRLARADLRALFDDPSSLVDTGFVDPEQVGDCRLYNADQERYVLRVDIAAGSSDGYDLQAEEGRTYPGAVVQATGDAFPDPDGTTASAIVRTPLRYIVVVLQQKPITPEKVRLILAMANKIAATRSGMGPSNKPFPTTNAGHHRHRLRAISYASGGNAAQPISPIRRTDKSRNLRVVTHGT